VIHMVPEGASSHSLTWRCFKSPNTPISEVRGARLRPLEEELRKAEATS
jgi:hypothetical protein